MKTKGVLRCQGEQCLREAVTKHVIPYRGLRFHVALCQEHGAELQALEGAEVPTTEGPASPEVIRITQGPETIAQICYSESCPTITIHCGGETPPMTGQRKGVSLDLPEGSVRTGSERIVHLGNLNFATESIP